MVQPHHPGCSSLNWHCASYTSGMFRSSSTWIHALPPSPLANAYFVSGSQSTVASSLIPFKTLQVWVSQPSSVLPPVTKDLYCPSLSLFEPWSTRGQAYMFISVSFLTGTVAGTCKYAFTYWINEWMNAWMAWQLHWIIQGQHSQWRGEGGFTSHRLWCKWVLELGELE